MSHHIANRRTGRRPSPTRRAGLVVVSAILALTGCGGTDSETGDEQSATFTIEDDTAVMVGVIGAGTPDAVRALVDDHPEVSTIELVDVPGSENDEANLEASLLVREAGLATHVPSDGVIASGGVDFFLAGASRSWDDGAMFGVHSWASGSTEGRDVPRDDPEHDLFLDYYDEIGVDEDFYWFTLGAADADSIHYMTDDELEEYGFSS